MPSGSIGLGFGAANKRHEKFSGIPGSVLFLLIKLSKPKRSVKRAGLFFEKSSQQVQGLRISIHERKCLTLENNTPFIEFRRWNYVQYFMGSLRIPRQQGIGQLQPHFFFCSVQQQSPFENIHSIFYPFLSAKGFCIGGQNKNIVWLHLESLFKSVYGIACSLQLQKIETVLIALKCLARIKNFRERVSLSLNSFAIFPVAGHDSGGIQLF